MAEPESAEAGAVGSTRAVVFVPGLTDGFMAVPYTTMLCDAVTRAGMYFVQPLLTSSYGGFGVSSLAQDSEELAALLTFLRSSMRVSEVLFIGHSTGCQNGVHILSTGCAAAALVTALVLQAPVSDREYANTLEDTPALLRVAEALEASGRVHELMPVAASSAPITASRFLSLSRKFGEDDMFSSDLSDPELRCRLGHLRVPLLVVMSGSDEYVPAHIRPAIIGARIAAAAASPLSRVLVFESANHALAGHEQAFVQSVLNFFGELPKLGRS